MGVGIYIVTLVVIASLLSASAAATNLTVASSTDEYVAAWQRKFQNDIKAADLKIECVNARGADSIKMMKDQQQELLTEIQRNEERLIPVQSLSVIRKHCVQKYQKLLVTYEAAERRTAACITSAQKRVDTLTSTAKTNVDAAKTSANVNFPKDIKTCNTTHYANQTKLEECVMNNVDSYSRSIETNLRAVDKSLDASLCTNTDLSRDAIKCSFSTEKNVLMTMGNVNTMIDKCINEAESVCPCAKNLMVGSETTSPSIRKMIMGT